MIVPSMGKDLVRRVHGRPQRGPVNAEAEIADRSRLGSLPWRDTDGTALRRGCCGQSR